MYFTMQSTLCIVVLMMKIDSIIPAILTKPGRRTDPSAVLLATLLSIVLPLLGLLIHGAPLKPYLELPPTTVYIEHAPFSLSVFTIYLSVVILSLFHLRPKNYSFRFRNRTLNKFAFPVWGYLSLMALLASWIVAWTRLPLFSVFQEHTFILLWGSYILLGNALLIYRNGSSPLTHQSAAFIYSFPISALFWWIFEYLNRFAQNWHYLNFEQFSPLDYTIFASLSFSTVLPSLWVTKEIVESVIDIQRKHTNHKTCRLPYSCVINLAALVCSISLLLLPFSPDLVFAFLWVAPPVLIIWAHNVFETKHPAQHLQLYSSTQLLYWALAGLTCGFFWELWNMYSLAKWIYLIPYVQGFHIFEMPAIGYAGYIPFGILAGMIINSILHPEEQS